MTGADSDYLASADNPEVMCTSRDALTPIDDYSEFFMRLPRPVEEWTLLEILAGHKLTPEEREASKERTWAFIQRERKWHVRLRRFARHPFRRAWQWHVDRILTRYGDGY